MRNITLQLSIKQFKNNKANTTLKLKNNKITKNAQCTVKILKMLVLNIKLSVLLGMVASIRVHKNNLKKN